MTRIRRARPEEAERLFGIWQAAVAATHDFVAADELAEIARIVRDDYLPHAPLWVIVDPDDRALGFMGMTGAKMDSLFVDPAHHRCGLGRKLVEHARADHAGLEVDVNEQNRAAVAFYRRLGFRQMGRSPYDDDGRPYPLLHLRLDG